jgi:hypothetical protein
MKSRNFKDSSWWYVPQWNACFGCAPKCGSTSLFKAISEHNLESWNPQPHERESYSVWIVREPVSRFKSLWKHKCRDEDVLWLDDEEPLLAGMSPVELMDYIEEHPTDDKHWSTQTSQCGSWVNELIPLEKLSKWWRAQGLPEMEVRGSTVGVIEISEELEARVLEFYKKDVVLYQQALDHAKV